MTLVPQVVLCHLADYVRPLAFVALAGLAAALLFFALRPGAVRHFVCVEGTVLCLWRHKHPR